jgi:D-amino-acid dehydrogenase
VVDRQSGPALETSYANGGQISVSYCEPWANRQAPWKALKWMFDKEAPLLFRPSSTAPMALGPAVPGPVQ